MNFMNDTFNKNKAVFEDTMKILETGSYHTGDKTVQLKLSPSRMRNISLFLPGMINALEELEWESTETGKGKTRIRIQVVNQDSFAAALQMKSSGKPVLVLNLANAVHPGGGVTKGSSAQEEDLCRRSSLYKSLSSSIASDYYNYNKGLKESRLGSNAVMVTPEVEIIKDEQGVLLDETHIVAVMTCAAPDLRDKEHGGTTMHGLTVEQHRTLLYTRISGMFRTAAYLGYRNLVLGAFGCGAFRNDPQIVAKVFKDVMNEFSFHGKKLDDLFDQITFAVLSRHNNSNYDVFRNALEPEEASEEVSEPVSEELTMQDKIRGSLFGGAVGDALGYAIEFDKEPVIFHRYGKGGITSYELDKNGKALISDDTQMSLFTAEGILFGETRSKMRGIGGPLSIYVEGSYQAWLITQEESFKHIHNSSYQENNYKNSSWLLDVPELFARRAPGNTCLQGLYTRQTTHGDFIAAPINNSKGCGGVMRTAPLAMRFAWEKNPDLRYLDREAAEMAAITHSHPLGYLPSAVLNHMLIGILRMNRNDSLKEIVLEAKEAVAEQFKDIEEMTVLAELIDQAVELAESGKPDLECIHRLGEGWVAEEALAIALYCTLKYPHDFSKAVIAAVNHKGDSDSTGAIAGNLVGALVGYDAIEDKWKKDLELKDVILEVADDLSTGCPCHEYSEVLDPVWMCKYGKRRRYVAEKKPSAVIRMIRGDITKVDTEAIVNAANSTLLGGGGVDGAIHRAAGPKLLAECRTLNGCKTGEAKITGAYNLPSKYVIHTVGPVWYGGTHGEEQDLAACYRNSLELAVENNIRTIAFPSISTGVYGYPVVQAAETAVKTVHEFVKQHPGKLDLVEWVLFDEYTFQVYEKALKETEQ